MKYKKRPVVIEAVRWTGKNLAELRKMDGFEEVHLCFNGKLRILTLEGIVDASVGDYIIRGVNGEFYPCKPDIFAKTYEPVVNVGGKPVGVYIHGVEMPKHCMDCPFMVSRDNDDCILQSAEANESFENWEQMKAGCPLVPVPPHGRLGDLDAIMEHLEYLLKYCEPESQAAQRTREMMVEIMCAATVIPESEVS